MMTSMTTKQTYTSVETMAEAIGAFLLDMQAHHYRADKGKRLDFTVEVVQAYPGEGEPEFTLTTSSYRFSDDR